MIRFFTIFRKLKLNNFSVKDVFLQFMEDFSEDKIPFTKLTCPACGAKNPAWCYHDSYERYLISYENKTSITYTINVTRIICSSCEHTHAILPEIIIPHTSYSLLFILTVLKEYFSKKKVEKICDKYQISTSTLYSWKKLFLIHKKLWLGILEDMYQDEVTFLRAIPNPNTSKYLSDFFLKTGYSFLQGVTKTAYFNSA
jgi:hypothetical protein